MTRERFYKPASEMIPMEEYNMPQYSAGEVKAAMKKALRIAGPELTEDERGAISEAIYGPWVLYLP